MRIARFGHIWNLVNENDVFVKDKKLYITSSGCEWAVSHTVWPHVVIAELKASEKFSSEVISMNKWADRTIEWIDILYYFRWTCYCHWCQCMLGVCWTAGYNQRYVNRWFSWFLTFYCAHKCLHHGAIINQQDDWLSGRLALHGQVVWYNESCGWKGMLLCTLLQM